MCTKLNKDSLITKSFDEISHKNKEKKLSIRIQGGN